jgi:hypothetical protein
MRYFFRSSLLRKSSFGLFSVFTMAFSITLHAESAHARVIEGTGNLASTNIRTSTQLYPACVTQVDRTGSIQLTGVIFTSNEPTGYQSTSLRDDCASPSSIIGTSRHRYEIQNATIAGRTGRIVIEAVGVYEGDATTPPGTRMRLQWKITGLDGDLKGMEGEGQSVGITTAFPNQPATNSSTYSVKLILKK